MSLHKHLNESETRYKIIDPFLQKACWNLAELRSVGFEIPIADYDASPLNGITDYCLHRDKGEVLAVIEAKIKICGAKLGKEQLLQLRTEIEAKQSFRLYGFLCNGDDIWLWDSNHYSDRSVAGLFMKVGLERLLFLKQNCQPLSTVAIKDGIKGLDLSEEDQQTLRERGIDPENIDYEGTDLEKKVTNKDTLKRQWAEYMDMCYKDAGGQLSAKTIVFAITHKHALRLEEAFNEMFPEHKGLLARVINSQTERNKDLLKQFEIESLSRIPIFLYWHLYNIHHN